MAGSYPPHGDAHTGEGGREMITSAIYAARLRSGHLEAISMGTVALCVTLWMRAKTVDQDERGNAERRALFVGLWPPTLWLIGESLRREERRRRRRFIR
jgi:hypothetical protein